MKGSCIWHSCKISYVYSLFVDSVEIISSKRKESGEEGKRKGRKEGRKKKRKMKEERRQKERRKEKKINCVLSLKQIKRNQ